MMTGQNLRRQRQPHHWIEKVGVYKIVGMISALLFFAAAGGCTMFAPVAQMTHIQIRGTSGQSNEFVLSLDGLLNSDSEIDLSERCSLTLDPQSLLDENDETPVMEMESGGLENTIAPLTPLCTFKYRF